MARSLIFLAVVLTACGGDGSDGGVVVQVPSVDQMVDAPDRMTDSMDAGPVDGELPTPDVGRAPDEGVVARPCESEQGVLPESYETLEHHDGEGFTDVPSQTWSVVGTQVSTAVLNESVVFELDRPARVLGYAVQYGALPSNMAGALEVTLQPDFGYNGFDFWPGDALARGSVCRSDVEPNEWVEFILPEPVVVADPGLVHVVHQRGAGGAAWLFDATPPTEDCGTNCCDSFGACHSAWNFPQLTRFVSGGQQNYAYNGLSLTFQYDYMVRLYVEYTDDVSPEDTHFTRVPDVETSNRMAWADYDNDGDDDLLVNGPRLLRNDDGEFIDVTEAAGLATEGLSGTGVFGDYDNDGCLDLFLFNESYQKGDHLLRSDCEGAFVEVTEESGIVDDAAGMSCDGGTFAPTPAAAWLDVDGDGYLDLYLSNFICWGTGENYLDTIWFSRGDGTFQNWTGRRGFPSADDADAFLASRGALPADFDGDGDVDILVNTYRLNRNLYFRNRNGRFEEDAEAAGLAGRLTNWQGFAYRGHHIGGAVGDLDGDADLDIVLGGLAHPRFFDFSAKTEVLINDGAGVFQDIQGDWTYPAGAAGLRFQETHSVPSLGDFDNDGALDLVISAVYDGRPTDFYWGNGDGTFVLDAWRSGLDVPNGWGQALADFDRDGRLDIATSKGIFRNQRPSEGRWLQTRVVGNVSANRAGIGSTVFVDVGDRTYVRVIGGSTGQGCQDSLSPHFGLGDAAQVDRVRVRFPTSESELVFEGPFDTDQRLWLFEDGRVDLGWETDW